MREFVVGIFLLYLMIVYDIKSLYERCAVNNEFNLLSKDEQSETLLVLQKSLGKF